MKGEINENGIPCRWARDATLGAEGCPIGVQVTGEPALDRLTAALGKLLKLSFVFKHPLLPPSPPKQNKLPHPAPWPCAGDRTALPGGAGAARHGDYTGCGAIYLAWTIVSIDALV